jgi:hypothetical protein
MGIQLETKVRNVRADRVETYTNTAPTLSIWSGTIPANCGASNTSGGGSPTKLVTMTLPSDWFAAAASGSKALSGTWQDASADASGTATFFRIHSSPTGLTGSATSAANDECVMQGTVGEGSGDLSLDNTNIAAGQQVTVTAFTLSEANP